MVHMTRGDVTLKAALLADWLEKEAPEIWWFLDGEREISASQSLPAEGRDLAAAFRRHGGSLVVVQEEPDQVQSGEVTDIDSLQELFDEADDGRALELAWLGHAGTSAPWLLVESVVNEDVKAIPPEAWNA
jgi:hypothetical protein